MQPHQPFLSIGPPVLHGMFKVNARSENKVDRLLGWIDKKVTILFGGGGKRKLSELNKLLGRAEESNEYRAVAEKYGIDELKKAYKNNLEKVLRAVSNLNITGKTIITSDHGDHLGEENRYGHNSYDEFLRVVPWLEVEESGL